MPWVGAVTASSIRTSFLVEQPVAVGVDPVAELCPLVSGAILVLNREFGQGVAHGQDHSVAGLRAVRSVGRGEQGGEREDDGGRAARGTRETHEGSLSKITKLVVIFVAGRRWVRRRSVRGSLARAVSHTAVPLSL